MVQIGVRADQPIVGNAYRLVRMLPGWWPRRRGGGKGLQYVRMSFKGRTDWCGRAGCREILEVAHLRSECPKTICCCCGKLGHWLMRCPTWIAGANRRHAYGGIDGYHDNGSWSQSATAQTNVALFIPDP